jgi:hypothetical protein
VPAVMTRYCIMILLIWSKVQNKVSKHSLSLFQATAAHKVYRLMWQKYSAPFHRLLMELLLLWIFLVQSFLLWIFLVRLFLLWMFLLRLPLSVYVHVLAYLFLTCAWASGYNINSLTPLYLQQHLCYLSHTLLTWIDIKYSRKILVQCRSW